jgi:hypothetical protein
VDAVGRGGRLAVQLRHCLLAPPVPFGIEVQAQAAPGDCCYSYRVLVCRAEVVCIADLHSTRMVDAAKWPCPAAGGVHRAPTTGCCGGARCRRAGWLACWPSGSTCVRP